jgi:hypothetical protein
MSDQPTLDFAHTPGADKSRKRKAKALAATAAGMGLQPYELKVLGSTPAAAAARREVRRAAGWDREPSVETWMLAVGYLESLARDLPGIVLCTDCGYPVRYVITELGRRLAIDPFPHPAGTVWPVTTARGQRARIIAGNHSRPDAPLYRQHPASCPARPAAGRARLRMCTVCGHPLDPVLAAREPAQTTHPTCTA